MAGPLARLKRRATTAGVPAIYINDNFGQWRSDFRKTVAHCTARSSPGRRVSLRLKPTSRDYFVLKPKHSGFFDTTLDTLLETLRIRRVILTGIAGNICVLFTANDAYMRDTRSSHPRTASSPTRPPTTITRPSDREGAERQHRAVRTAHLSSEPRLQGRRSGDERRWCGFAIGR